MKVICQILIKKFLILKRYISNLRNVIFSDLDFFFQFWEKKLWPGTADCLQRQSSSTSIGIERTCPVLLEIFFCKNFNTLKIFTVHRVHFHKKVLYELFLNDMFYLWLPSNLMASVIASLII